MNVKRHAIVETYFHYSCIVYHNDIADPILAATIQITTVGHHDWPVTQSDSQVWYASFVHTMSGPGFGTPNRPYVNSGSFSMSNAAMVG
jgi:hypothetical protein